MSSASQVLVAEIEAIGPHFNADSLEVATVFGNPCIVKKGEYSTGMKVAYIPVEMLVPTGRPEFEFLKGKARGDGTHKVKAIKLRGVFSMGLVVPCDQSLPVESDLTEALGCVKFEPTIHGHIPGSNQDEYDPGFIACYTDIEAYAKYANKLFDPDEEVVCTEKVHGCNARFAWDGERLWCGSRTRIKKDDETNLWWRVARDYNLEGLLSGPRLQFVLYGEIYGNVQDLRYGVPQGQARAVFFDAKPINGPYLDFDVAEQVFKTLGLPTAPVLYRGAFKDIPVDLAEGFTIVGDGANVREGYVVRPVRERFDQRTGRVILKCVGQGYHLRKEAA